MENILGYSPIFKPAREKHLKNSKHNSLHFTFLCSELTAHSFPRPTLSENCSPLGTSTYLASSDLARYSSLRLLILVPRGLVQSLNSPFFPPPIGAEPGRAKGESRITCMRMLRTKPFFTSRSSEKPYLEVLSKFGLWRDFLNNNNIAKIFVYKHWRHFRSRGSKSLVRVVGKRAFEPVKSFAHRRISNTIFGRCRYSNFLQTLTVQHFDNILTFLLVSEWNLAYMWSDSRLKYALTQSFLLFLSPFDNHEYCVTVLVASLISSLYKQQFLYSDWLKTCQLMPNQWNFTSATLNRIRFVFLPQYQR